MPLPEVLSFRGFRAGLAATLKRVQEPEAGPVFVGAHRRPEAVVMSVAHDQCLRDAAERRQPSTRRWRRCGWRGAGAEPGRAPHVRRDGRR